MLQTLLVSYYTQWNNRYCCYHHSRFCDTRSAVVICSVAIWSSLRLALFWLKHCLEIGVSVSVIVTLFLSFFTKCGLLFFKQGILGGILSYNKHIGHSTYTFFVDTHLTLWDGDTLCIECVIQVLIEMLECCYSCILNGLLLYLCKQTYFICTIKNESSYVRFVFWQSSPWIGTVIYSWLPEINMREKWLHMFKMHAVILHARKFKLNYNWKLNISQYTTT